MTSGKSKRDRRLAEAKKRAALYGATPRTRYGPAPARSQAWANAQRRRQRRNILRVVGGFSVVIVILVIVIIVQRRNNHNVTTASNATIAPTVDTSVNSEITTSTTETATTAAPIPPPALTAQAVAGATGALGVSTTLNAYEIKYDSTFQGTSGPSNRTNDYLVQRPFNSSIKIVATDPESTAGSFTAVSSFGSASGASGGSPSAQTNVPSAGLADFRFDASLDDLVADGTYVLKERRTLIGRECQMYRTGQTPESYGVAAPTDKTYADLCIDNTGLILEEITVVDGSFQEHNVATAVNESPTPAADAFKALATPPALSDGGVTLAPLDATKAPVASYWGFSSLPAGYTLQGRYTYVQNIPDPAATASTAPAATVDPSAPTTAAKTITVPSYVDVYVNGPNYIVVHQGPKSVVPQDAASAAKATTSATLGSVQTVSGLTGTSMLITPATPTDWFVEVNGTLSKAALAKIADTLGPAK